MPDRSITKGLSYVEVITEKEVLSEVFDGEWVGIVDFKRLLEEADGFGSLALVGEVYL